MDVLTTLRFLYGDGGGATRQISIELLRMTIGELERQTTIENETRLFAGSLMTDEDNEAAEDALINVLLNNPRHGGESDG